MRHQLIIVGIIKQLYWKQVKTYILHTNNKLIKDLYY